jgi:GT2 family glycosyltransferase
LTFSIIVPVYNKIEIIRSCLISNIENCFEPQEWIIIDNDSDEETKRGLRDIQIKALNLGHDFIIITETSNTGVAKAWNKGLFAASKINVCILNNDCVLMPNWDKAANYEIKKGKLHLFSPFILEPPMFSTNYGEKDFQTGKSNWAYFLSKNQNRYRKGYFDGVVLIGEKKVFEAVGNFDESYWLTMEDIDFQHRCVLKNYTIGKTGNIVGFHHISATRKTMNVNEEKNNKHFENKFGFDFPTKDMKWINKWIRSYDKKLFKFFGKMGTFSRVI